MKHYQKRRIKRFAYKLLKQKSHKIALEKVEINEMDITPAERCQKFVELIYREIFKSDRMNRFLHRIGCPNAVVGGTVDFQPNTSKVNVIVGDSSEEVFFKELETVARNPLRTDTYIKFENITMQKA